MNDGMLHRHKRAAKWSAKRKPKSNWIKWMRCMQQKKLWRSFEGNRLWERKKEQIINGIGENDINLNYEIIKQKMKGEWRQWKKPWQPNEQHQQLPKYANNATLFRIGLQLTSLIVPSIQLFNCVWHIDKNARGSEYRPHVLHTSHIHEIKIEFFDSFDFSVMVSPVPNPTKCTRKSSIPFIRMRVFSSFFFMDPIKWRWRVKHLSSKDINGMGTMYVSKASQMNWIKAK